MYDNTLPIATLYVVQNPFADIDSMLHELCAILQPQDYVILLQDSVFALHHPLKLNCPIAVLADDAHLIPAHLQDQIHIIDYLKLADLLQISQKVLTWK